MFDQIKKNKLSSKKMNRYYYRLHKLTYGRNITEGIYKFQHETSNSTIEIILQR
jgi:transposase-like protein